MRLRYFALILIGIAIRLILAYYPYGNYDQVAWDTVAHILRDGGNLYAETERYNYSPFWSFFLYALSYIPLPLHFSVRTFLTIIDILICYLIYKITGKDSYAAIFMINPVSILTTGFHGQFENFSVLPIIFAIYLYQKRSNLWWFFILGALSLLTKHITFFTILALFFAVAKSKSKAVLMTLGAISIFVVSFLPYLPSGRENIINSVFLYSGNHLSYGIQSFLKGWSTVPFAVCMIGTLYLFRKRPLEEQLLAATIAFLVFTPGIGEQYFVLPLIFGAMNPSPGYFIFSFGASIFLLGSNNNLNLPLPSVWNSVWVCSVLWFGLNIIPKQFKEKCRERLAAFFLGQKLKSR